jgi:ATP-dependent Clp protease ATP-binding subunit ClpA
MNPNYERIRIVNYPNVQVFPFPAARGRFTDGALGVLEDACRLALQYGILGTAPPLLILWANLGRWDKNGRLGYEMLKACGVDRLVLEQDILNDLAPRFGSAGTLLDLEPICEVASLAEVEAARLDRNYVGSEHFVLALFRSGDEPTLRLLCKHGITYERFQEKLAELMDG